MLASGDHIPLGVLVHGFSGGQRSFLAEIDKRRLAVMRAQKKESAAAQVARDGMHDGQRKPGGHGCVHGVAAFTKDVEARIRREVMHAHHHAVRCPNRLFAAIGQHVLFAFLRRNAGGQETAGRKNGSQNG